MFGDYNKVIVSGTVETEPTNVSKNEKPKLAFKIRSEFSYKIDNESRIALHHIIIADANNVEFFENFYSDGDRLIIEGAIFYKDIIVKGKTTRYTSIYSAYGHNLLIIKGDGRIMSSDSFKLQTKNKSNQQNNNPPQNQNFNQPIHQAVSSNQKNNQQSNNYGPPPHYQPSYNNNIDQADQNYMESFNNPNIHYPQHQYNNNYRPVISRETPIIEDDLPYN